VPFASPNALFNLSKFSVWWLRLGIAIERIKPGRPQQNGRHERMHLTLKAGNDSTARHEQLAATGALRPLRPGIQHRAAPTKPWQ
jgi:transposase InsO family protein